MPKDLSVGQLSQFLTLETIGACAADLEWGGVNDDVQRLVERYGTEEEARVQVVRSSSPDRECLYGPSSATFIAACLRLGLPTE